MKRLALLTISLLVLVATLTSCIVIPRYRYFEIDATTVESVEIYDLSKSESRYSNFLETETPVYKIPADKTSAFLDDFSKIRFSNPIIIVLAAIDPSFAYSNWTVRINYTDGSFELLSSGGYGQSFDANGENISAHHWSCEEEDLSELIGKYLPGEIINHTH